MMPFPGVPSSHWTPDPDQPVSRQPWTKSFTFPASAPCNDTQNWPWYRRSRRMFADFCRALAWAWLTSDDILAALFSQCSCHPWELRQFIRIQDMIETYALEKEKRDLPFPTERIKGHPYLDCGVTVGPVDLPVGSAQHSRKGCFQKKSKCDLQLPIFSCGKSRRHSNQALEIPREKARRKDGC